MARLEQLVGGIQEGKLRREIELEIAALKERTRFGLVYERHLPETVLIADPDLVRVGVLVRPKQEVDKETSYRVIGFNGKKELREYLAERSMRHTRGRPYHPMTQGKIERYHRTMKNVVLLNNYWLPGELEREIERFVSRYNHERVHESLDNLTPADVYFGRVRDIRTARERLKEQTMRRRERINRGLTVTPEERILPALYREALP